MAENMPTDSPQRTMSTSVNITSSNVTGNRRLMSSTMSNLGQQRLAQVAAHYLAYPHEVLYVDGLIQPEFSANAFLSFRVDFAAAPAGKLRGYGVHHIAGE